VSFIAYCYRCERKATAHTKLGDAELLSALTSDAFVEVGHISDGDGDHSWKLNKRSASTF
jgi:hypothetical protein